MRMPSWWTMAEGGPEGHEVDPATEQSDRAWLEGQVRELEAVNEGLRAANHLLTTRVQHLRAEIDRLGRIVRVGGVARGVIRDPRRLRQLRLDVAQAIQPRPISEPASAQRPDPVLAAEARRATVLAAIEVRRRQAPAQRRVEDLRIGLVADPPLHQLLAGVCTVVPLSPDDAPATIAAAGLDLVLVESAWAGFDGSWRYRIAWHPHQRSIAQVELAALTTAARAAGIPSAFWMTAARHDATRFADAARRFDHLFATDDSSLARLDGDRERRWVSADLLNPGVRVDLHHPSGPPETRAPLFLGSIPLALPLERREAIDAMLRAAAPYGLVVGDRQAGGDPSHFGRPDMVAGVAASRPPATSIAGLFRRHAAVLLPSLSATSAAVPARIFEALACGAPVITTRADAVAAAVGDLAVASDDPGAITAALQEALEGNAFRDRVRAGAAALARTHDIRRRLAVIATAAGIQVADPAGRVDVQVLADDPAAFASLAADLEGQADAIASVVVGTTAWEAARSALPGPMAKALAGRPVRIVEQDRDESGAQRHRRLATVTDGPRVVMLDVESTEHARAAAGGLAGMLGCAAASGASVVALPIVGSMAAHTAATSLAPFPALVDRQLVEQRGWPATAAALEAWVAEGVTVHAAAPAGASGARP